MSAHYIGFGAQNRGEQWGIQGDEMQADFWHAMWASGAVGFHQSDINGFLRMHWPDLALQGDETVLVPLCGKSLDMLWLRQQGHAVLGVELSPKALDEFVLENQLPAKSLEHSVFGGYQLPSMRLLCGDFFRLSAQECSSVRAVYDRAAIVALPDAMRRQYAAHLGTILAPGTRMLMVTMEYDSSLLAGPPFSVPEAEIRGLFDGCAQLEKVAEQTFSRKGVAAVEKVFLLRF